MKNFSNIKELLFTVLATLVLVVLAPGCGYSTQVSLPDHVQTVHVAKVENRIDISSEISNKKAFQTYRPGLEVELRNALIERFIFDGHLKVENKEKADSIISAKLLSFDREPIKYTSSDAIQEFRIYIAASAVLTDVNTSEVLWSTDHISGDSTYLLSGRLAKTEDEAVGEALEDLVRNIVEEVLEVW